MRTCENTHHYVDKDDPWLGILFASDFSIISTIYMMKSYSPGQLIFGHDIILLIKHTLDWELIRQKNQAPLNNDNIREKRNQVDCY